MPYPIRTANNRLEYGEDLGNISRGEMSFREQFRKCFNDGTATEKGLFKPLTCGISGGICSSKNCPKKHLGKKLPAERRSVLKRSGLLEVK